MLTNEIDGIINSGKFSLSYIGYMTICIYLSLFGTVSPVSTHTVRRRVEPMPH